MADFCDSPSTVRALRQVAERGNPLIGEVEARRFEFNGGALVVFVDQPRADAPRLTSTYLVPEGAVWAPEYKVEAEIYVEEVAGEADRIAVRLQEGGAELVVVSTVYTESRCAL